ncbi:nocturnin-like isoform X2 [Anneissia japonica]|nr:nocturnin-like isoform X2 [Anneissia japonica]XP_033112061.1 nocturnin-like isoform X2 [Anneissia japonica]
MDVIERFLTNIYRSAFLPLVRVMAGRKRFLSASRGPAVSTVFEALSDKDEVIKKCQELLQGHPPLLRRSFHELPSAPNLATVRIMQWNILADALGNGGDNFIKCPKEALNWETRKFRILEELLIYDPDVMCLQEVDHYHDFFDPILKVLGYHGTFMAKPSSPCLDNPYNNGPDGCALFFKSDKFDLINCEKLVLKVTHDGYQRWSNQVGIISTLRYNILGQSKKEIVVGVTHLKAKAGCEYIRHSQGLDLHEHFSNQIGSHPGVLVGDFNAETSEEVYCVFAESPLNLNSAYKLLSKDGQTEPDYTTWKIRKNGEQCHTIDYMWYTKEGLAVKRLLHIPTGEEIGKDRLPSETYPSDHLSLVCDFLVIDH